MLQLPVQQGLPLYRCDLRAGIGWEVDLMIDKAGLRV